MESPRIFKVLTAAVLSLSLSACSLSGEPGPSLKIEKSALEGCAQIAGNLSEKDDKDIGNIVKLVREADQRLDVMLSCFIGPAPKLPDGSVKPKPTVSTPMTSADLQALYDYYAGALTSSDQDDALRLYRGHLIIAVLARYGAFNTTGEVGDFDVRLPNINAEDAMDILGAIHEAQYESRRSTDLFTSDSLRPPYLGPSDSFPHVKQAYKKLQRIRRVIAVTELAAQAATPTVRRTLSFARQMATTIRTPTRSGVKEMFKNAKSGLEKLAIINHVGPAYRADVKDLVNAAHGSAISKAQWQTIDKDLIDEACARLSQAAGVNYDCTPGEYK